MSPTWLRKSWKDSLLWWFSIFSAFSDTTQWRNLWDCVIYTTVFLKNDSVFIFRAKIINFTRFSVSSLEFLKGFWHPTRGPKLYAWPVCWSLHQPITLIRASSRSTNQRQSAPIWTSGFCRLSECLLQPAPTTARCLLHGVVLWNTQVAFLCNDYTPWASTAWSLYCLERTFEFAAWKHHPGLASSLQTAFSVHATVTWLHLFFFLVKTGQSLLSINFPEWRFSHDVSACWMYICSGVFCWFTMVPQEIF